MKIKWKQNLLVAQIGYFFIGASISLVMPFIPVYVEQLGAPKSQIELFSGLAISVMAFTTATVAPIWGNLANQKGRRIMMIHAAAGVTIIMGALAFAPNIYWLLIMRFMNGILSGYVPNATAMIASQTPKEKNGQALGTLSTGATAGMLTTPSIGSTLAQQFEMENVFIITGVILFVATLLAIFLVKEDFQPVEREDLLTTKEIFSKMGRASVLIGLFVVTLILQLGITSIGPILALYIRSLSGDTENVLFVSGLIVSIAGVPTVTSSPTLGKIGDRIGNQKVLLGGLILSFICYIPMAFMQIPSQLGVLQSLLDFSTGVPIPSINTLISKITPTGGVSRIYSYNQMYSSFGQILGPVVGSTTTHGFDCFSVFLVTTCFVLGNIGLSFFNFRKALDKKL